MYVRCNICFSLQEFISRLNDIDHILDEVENQYKSLQADGYVTAADGLATQVRFFLLDFIGYLGELSILICIIFN